MSCFSKQKKMEGNEVVAEPERMLNLFVNKVNQQPALFSEFVQQLHEKLLPSAGTENQSCKVVECTNNTKVDEKKKRKKKILQKRKITFGSKRCPQTDHSENIQENLEKIQGCTCKLECKKVTLDIVGNFYNTYTVNETELERNRKVTDFLKTNCVKHGENVKHTRYHVANLNICRDSFLVLIGMGPRKLTLLKKYGIDESGRIRKPMKKTETETETEKHKEKTKIILSFFQDIKKGGDVEEDPSYKQKVFLPYYIAKQEDLYVEYREWMKTKSLPDDKSCQQKFFFQVWKEYFEEITIQKKSFMECNICSSLQEEMKFLEKTPEKETGDNQKERIEALEEAKREFEEHKELARKFREKYKTEKDEAPKQPHFHLTMDYSSAFNLPFKKREPQLLSMGPKFKTQIYGISDHKLRQFHNFIVPETANRMKSFVFFIFFNLKKLFIHIFNEKFIKTQFISSHQHA